MFLPPSRDVLVVDRDNLIPNRDTLDPSIYDFVPKRDVLAPDNGVLAQSTEVQMFFPCREIQMCLPKRDKDVLASKGRGDDERDHTKRGGEETGGGGTSRGGTTGEKEGTGDEGVVTGDPNCDRVRAAKKSSSSTLMEGRASGEKGSGEDRNPDRVGVSTLAIISKKLSISLSMKVTRGRKRKEKKNKKKEEKGEVDV
ncbi:hypothetical protein BDB01DRAFT_882230 [Pilobolus umbonatus]|nr:hypothetical protein BDB01DRAFT_882230 [Pilobolus umbonatus]